MQGNEEGAEGKLLGGGTLWRLSENRVKVSGEVTNSNVIAPADPTAQAFMQAAAPDPLPPSRFDDSLFKEWASEKDRGQEKNFGNVDDRYGVPA